MTRKDGATKQPVSKGEATGRTVACQAPGTRPPPVTARLASISGSGISLW